MHAIDNTSSDNRKGFHYPIAMATNKSKGMQLTSALCCWAIAIQRVAPLVDEFTAKNIFVSLNSEYVFGKLR